MLAVEEATIHAKVLGNANVLGELGSRGVPPSTWPASPRHIPGRSFRMRRLVIEPGGVVPWHSHGERPAIIYVVQGTVTEYASSCSVPIVHTAGDATPELHNTAHWWKNTGKTQAVLLSADLLKVGDDDKMM